MNISRPIGTPGNNDADWWLNGLHCANLHRRGMRAKHLAFAIGIGRQVECVMLLTGGVLGRNIQRGKAQALPWIYWNAMLKGREWLVKPKSQS